MKTLASLKGHFLVATPVSQDPVFSKSVVLVCSHDPQAALGLTLHRPMAGSVQDLLEQLDISTSDSRLNKQPVLSGGPVETQRGFVLHTPTEETWESTGEILPGVLSLTSSRDILEAIGQGQGPEEFCVALGYAGWEAGQLDQEVRNGDWLIVPYDPILLFNIPAHKKWETTPRWIGVDMAQLPGFIGHA